MSRILTPGQLHQLRQELTAFAEAGESTSLQRDFCRFYGIDFTDVCRGLEYRLGSVACGRFSLAVHRWLQPGASSNLLLVHGYYDHSGLFNKLIEYGLARNCNVLIFDLPGHGLSSGEPAVIDDFADYGHAIKAVLDAADLPALPQWVMAQSTGCAALVEYARRYSWPFTTAVLLAPLLRPYGWRFGKLAYLLVRPFTDSIRREFAPNSSDPDFLRFLRDDPLQARRLPVRWVTAMRRWMASVPAADLGVGPALLVQGDTDYTVDGPYNVEFYRQLFPASRVVELAGAGHQLANEAQELRQTYLAEVDSWLDDVGLPTKGAGEVV